MGFFRRLKNDIVTLRGAWRSLRMTMHIGRNPTRVFPNVLEELAAKYGDAPALISDREQFTYAQLFARSNRYSRWALRAGIGKGDSVCLLMPNRPEYFAAWIGVTRVGGIVALLNTNLSGAPLAHCIDIAKAKHIIVAAELSEAFERTKPLLKSKPVVWSHGAGDGPRIDEALAELPETSLSPAERPTLTIEDRALYIYTSGTTGLPKAANVNHYRIMLACFGFVGVMNVRHSDRMYDCLPMYHTAGGLVAIGPLLVMGGSTVIREKFSAREFFDDIVRYDCTLVQYIGELCRYLINSPRHANERNHNLRLACGNGLRPDIWDEFKARFRIPSVLEFYAATEGNVLLFNFEDKSGAIGRLPWYLKWRFPTELVKFDVEKEQPVRDAAGRCIVCAVDEVGEAIGKIVVDPSRPGGRFEGYANRQEDERKILRNVFAEGDAWFRTGDLMRRDKDGYFYFVDRIGDTFRWKGENVSTTEVAEAINDFPGISDTTVYGVHIPNYDGRAGMAAVVCEACDLKGLYRHITQALPDYARPVFIRMRTALEVTSTFKQKKIDLVRDGFDPTAVYDPIYFRDDDAETFVPLDKPLYDSICSGKMRL
ncbi:MAG TPA: long-chain-acyl-CoA synthetase [Pseudorhodoplanes sp.]|nr:long-chain-acyl-CoA synthetase [Pseudorhodoplanes sp.]